MKLILVRHGETQPNKDGRILGVGDAPLNTRGRAQARAVAGALEEYLPFRLYTSPVARAMETAEAIAAALKVPRMPLDALAEADAGELEGLTGKEMRERYPDFARRWAEDSGTARMPGGESLVEVQERAWRAVQGLLDEHPEDTIVAVTHNFTIQTIVSKMLGMPLGNARALRLDVGSITRLDLSRSHGVLGSLNETSHLPSPAP